MDSTDQSSQTTTPSKRLRMEEESTEASDVFKKPPWSDLPYELLEQIAARLPFIELLSFRKTCKPWRLASLKAYGESNDSANLFLLYGNDPNCRLYDTSSEKIHNIDFPELCGAECIASSGGWLLVYRKGLMFFFCPFSRAKIDLPKFPKEELSNPIATFSSIPTSPGCIVCVGTKISEHSLELNVLRRGASEWVTYISKDYSKLRNVVTGAALCDDILYVLDKKTMALTFELESEKWKAYNVIRNTELVDSSMEPLPFFQIMAKCGDSIKQKLGLKDSDSLTTCGAYIQGKDTCIHNEEIQANSKHGGEDLSHKKKGVWIQPRFFQLPATQTWSL